MAKETVKKKIEQNRKANIGDGINKRIIDKGRMKNDELNMKRMMKCKPKK